MSKKDKKIIKDIGKEMEGIKDFVRRNASPEKKQELIDGLQSIQDNIASMLVLKEKSNK